MFNFGDKEIGQDVLTSQKFLTNFIAQASVEAADPRLRNVLGQLHSEAAADARQVFDYLHSRGWYEVRPASISAVQDLMNTAQQLRQEITGINVPYGQLTGTAASTYVPGGYGTAGVYGGMGTTGYTAGMSGGINLPEWTRHEVRSEGGYQGDVIGQQYGGMTGMMTGSNLPQWARHDPQLGQSYQAIGGQQGFGGYQAGYGQMAPGYTGFQGGYGANLPAWTRQEVRGTEYPASGGPVAHTAYPGGPSVYQGGQIGTPAGFGAPFTGGYVGGYGGGYYGGTGVGLPAWTRQEVPGEQHRFGQLQPSIYQGYTGGFAGQQAGFRGGYGGMVGGYGTSGYGTTGYGTTGYTGNLPAWTRQEVRGTEFPATGGPIAQGAYPGGPGVYQGGAVGTPVQSVYRGIGGQAGTGVGQSVYQGLGTQYGGGTSIYQGQTGNLSS
ncbi:MAG: spore coat protein [Bacillota bacterium]